MEDNCLVVIFADEEANAKAVQFIQIRMRASRNLSISIMWLRIQALFTIENENRIDSVFCWLY